MNEQVTPAEGLIVISRKASSGISSLGFTSIGPLIDARRVVGPSVYCAEPSAIGRGERRAVGGDIVWMYVVVAVVAVVVVVVVKEEELLPVFHEYIMWVEFRSK